MEEVISSTSKEAIEAKAAPIQAEVKPVEETERKVVESEPVKVEDDGTVKPEEKKPEEESSTIRQMRKALKAQSQQIAELRQIQHRQQIAVEPAPIRENFNDDAAYIKATVDHTIKQTMQAQPQAPDAFAGKVSELTKEHPDFGDALQDVAHIILTPEAVNTIKQTVLSLPYGKDVYYHMVKNPELAEELAILPPAALAARLGDIHGDIRRSKETKQTKAPPPISPVSGATKPEKGYEDITDQGEFNARRRKEKEAHNKARYGF